MSEETAHDIFFGVVAAFGVLIVAAIALSLIGFAPAPDCPSNVTTIAKDQSRVGQ